MPWTQSYVKIRWLAASSRCHLQKLCEPTGPPGHGSSPSFGGLGIAVSSRAGSEGRETQRNSPETREGEDFAQFLGGGDRDSGWCRWRRASRGSGGGEPGGPRKSTPHRVVGAPGCPRPAVASLPGRGTQRGAPLRAVILLEGRRDAVRPARPGGGVCKLLGPLGLLAVVVGFWGL